MIKFSSSAVQILPTIQPVVESLINFVRSPNWLLTSIGTEQRDYTQEEIDIFTHEPGALMALRKANENVVNSIFGKTQSHK